MKLKACEIEGPSFRPKMSRLKIPGGSKPDFILDPSKWGRTSGLADHQQGVPNEISFPYFDSPSLE